MALDGKICLCLHPPGYSSKRGKIHNCIESLNLFLGKDFYSAVEITNILFLFKNKNIYFKHKIECRLFPKFLPGTVPSKATL
jgi:hypothetical protein